MLYLLGSIILTSYLTLAFKACEKLDISIFQAIVFNYITCVITGTLIDGIFPVTSAAMRTSWFWWACGMGVLFILLFNIIGITAQKNGVAVASVANKLSLVIPVLLSVFLYGESVRGWKLIGIIVALIAVVLTCYQPAKPDSAKNTSSYFLPFVLFIGSGLLDSLINHTQKNYVTESTHNAFLVTGFFSAATIGMCLLIVQYLKGRQQFATKHIVAGIFIGVPNYFSIWCLLKFLKESPWQSSASIPVNNMGIVLFSSIVAWLLFKERLSAVNWIGIILSVISIALIAFG